MNACPVMQDLAFYQSGESRQAAIDARTDREFADLKAYDSDANEALCIGWQEHEAAVLAAYRSGDTAELGRLIASHADAYLLAQAQRVAERAVWDAEDGA